MDPQEADNLPPVAPVFALTPAHVTQNRILNYTQKQDCEIYKTGMTPLTDKFEGEPTKLAKWLEQVGDKAHEMNWMNILTMANGKDIIKHYGDITAEQVKAASEAYQILNGQAAQNSSMLYTCLCQSITKEVSTKASNNSARYKLVLNPGAVNQEFREDGPCFLKAIIDEYYTNTMSNTAVARRSLARLNEYINQAVQENLQKLEAASETTLVLVVNLFDGYMEAEDKPFCRYVTNLYEQWSGSTDA